MYIHVNLPAPNSPYGGKRRMDARVPYEKRLQEAKRVAKARAEAEAKSAEPDVPQVDYTVEEALVLLTIEMFRTGLTVGMGVLPDGMAVYVRLRMPSKAEDPRAGMVAFLAGSDAPSALSKALHALESSSKSNYWKPDRFAQA